MSILDSDWRAIASATAAASGAGAASGVEAADEPPLTDPATGRPVDTPTIERIR
jgi:hypothetical protein